MKKALFYLIIIMAIFVYSCSEDSNSPSDKTDDTYELKGTVTLADGIEKTDLAHVYCVWKSPMSGMYIMGKSPIDWDKMTFEMTLETPLHESCYYQDGFAFCYLMVFPTAGYAADINEKIATDNIIGISDDDNIALIDNLENELVKRDLPNAEKGFMHIKVIKNSDDTYSFQPNNSEISVEITK